MSVFIEMEYNRQEYLFPVDRIVLIRHGIRSGMMGDVHTWVLLADKTTCEFADKDGSIYKMFKGCLAKNGGTVLEGQWRG